LVWINSTSCAKSREELTEGGYNIGRVIARPFVGDKAGNFQRTGNRHDLAVEPPAPTVLQKLVDEKDGHVVSVGKIADIYANCGITKKVKATGLDALFDATIKEMKEAGDETIVFTNFVDFDSSWGHRRRCRLCGGSGAVRPPSAGADGAGG
jgi:phosphopentomutase